jgi:Ca2+-binding RTX toxin-like protein
MRRRILTLMLGAFLAMLIAGGVALAEPGPGSCEPVHNDLTGGDAQWCKGTDGPDTLIDPSPTGDDRLDALGGNDKVYGLGGIDALYGRSGDDEIHGDAAPDNYTGEVGTADWDAIYGGEGVDNLFGDAGIDVLYAGQDADRDSLDGGAEPDVYVVKKSAFKAGADVITDQNFKVKEGVRLEAGDDISAVTLRKAAMDGGPHLYFYP